MYNLLLAYTFLVENTLKLLIYCFKFAEYTAGMQRFYQMSTLCWLKWEYLLVEWFKCCIETNQTENIWASTKHL